MSLKRTWLWWAVIMLLAGPGAAAAQSDVFMCVDGITGSSTDDQSLQGARRSSAFRIRSVSKAARLRRVAEVARPALPAACTW